jgi:rabconnectin-3b
MELFFPYQLPDRLCSMLKLRAQWTMFTEPLLTVIPLDEEGVGRLRDCILCVSDDGTIAVIAVDGLELSV